MKKTEVKVHKNGQMATLIEADQGKLLRLKLNGWTTGSAYLGQFKFNGEIVILKEEDFEEIDDNDN